MRNRLKKFILDVYAAITDPAREISERVFISLTIITELAVFVAFIGDIITRENVAELIVLVVTLIFIPVITFTSLFKDKLRIAIRIIVIGMVVIILPALYFFGGGIRGGGVLWFIFAFMYVGLVINSAWRIGVILMLVVQVCICYLTEYHHPELIRPHTRDVFFVDSFISLVLVGILCSLMTWFQNRMFREENARAKKEAERAEELTRSQNRFFSSMSHEIRTPINSILGLNELILRDSNTSDEIVNDAAGIQGAGKMLLALINDILDFSKIEAGSMDIVPVDYKVGELISEVVNMIWLRAQEKGLRFDVSVDPEVPSVLYGDEVRIKQVIINLLNNAVKYTHSGNIGLSIESSEHSDEAVMLSISVSDSGMGIKKEAIPYLFDAFKRVDEEKNRHIEGTGLGLSIVKQLIDLMDGTITVNSVYGEGTTFTAVIRQHISDPTPIGELNIHNQQTVRRSKYESGFRAPEARILIVDDNEMNLEVECRLLEDTEMTIDRAVSGKEALDKVQKNNYDTILMDHLMPEMDGIECLERIRSQAGGLNRATPIVVLTANAGSENRELYNRAGFDGYLVKPVSGEALEEMIIRHVSSDKLILNNRMMRMRENINTTAGYSGKVPVIITATSGCDLPYRIIEKLNIAIIPFLIRTEEGVFKDGVQMDANELIRYIRSGRNAVSSSAGEYAYTEFFGDILKRSHHVIHIAITPSMSDDFRVASEAAKAFDNVTVINSECLSSAMGILVMIAGKMVQQNIPVPEIISELETVKKRMKCSFIMDTTEYMAKKGLITNKIHRLADYLNLHPSLKMSGDRSHLGGIWMGNTERAYKKYISSAFPVDIIPDPEVVFITYIGVPVDTLMWIKEEISKYAYFEHVLFKQASAAISSNCGPGTFGILYFVKSNKSYNLSSFIDDEPGLVSDDDNMNTAQVVEEVRSPEEREESLSEEAPETENVLSEEAPEAEEKGSGSSEWYHQIEGVDGDMAMKNSGSEEALKMVLKIFYDSISAKSSEINSFYEAEDWRSYVIRVHALKSSARLIGAPELGDKAESLEMAGKAGDTDFIRANHESFMEDYLKYRGYLDKVFNEEPEDKPVADEYLMESVYEGLCDAAKASDCNAIEDILKELKDYAIPENEQEKFKAIREKVDNFDYDGILAVLGEKQEG